ncbi:proline--tRNA ligase [Eggerthella sp. YY7918]|uniref:proline--tRNA ligase n=1 Tax=Eggerthella sp. (strain YY7918) TaxID=502558 RepID=UPI0002170F45|nr:proline--tRNA ligase [Eggerthella sp. YY7918]BAK43889.1 prolyl-tRNA synthetase [Eggerthella sp. YY7918]
MTNATNANILRMSKLYAPTLKEDPADAEIASHKLLTRAGFIRKTASGVYTFLPLGKKVLAKVENIVREEMDAIGAQEIMMPALQPAELWYESGRWNDYGPELMRLKDRHDHELCLGPTHEELLTALVRNELRSYKQLPMSLYQIQVKFRDEIRPRFGLLRSREFIMKDAYSFHANQESLQKTYDEMSAAYGRICERMQLDYRPVAADPGQIGGNVTCEFMALAESGEAELVHCSCGYAANTEAGDCLARPTVYDVPEMKKIATPNVHTIAELAAFLDIPESSTVKALSGKDDEGKLVVLFIPGDHELNELKAARAAGGFTLLTDEDMETFGLHKGSMGPVGLPKDARIIAARSLQAVPKWVVGANEDGYHYVGARLGEDFQVDEWADLCTVQPGDSCPECGLPLEGARGIEVSQVFQLGDKYSRAMNATFMAEDGSEQPYLMGCYGVGISRTMAAIVEQHNDEYGISWPLSVAPAHVCVIPLTVGDDEVQPAAEKLAADLASLGLEVAIDDRSERAGVKFADADLIGWPLQVIVGKRGLAEQKVEIKRRSTGARRDISLVALTDALAFSRRNIRVWGSEMNLFGGLFE